MHPSDQITRAGLERIKAYCKSTECNKCQINGFCTTAAYHLSLFQQYILPEKPRDWDSATITIILTLTRNYMEASFINSLEKIVKNKGECTGVECNDCPFWHTSTRIDYHNNNCSSTTLHNKNNAKHAERKQISEWLLDIYQGNTEPTTPQPKEAQIRRTTCQK